MIITTPTLPYVAPPHPTNPTLPHPTPPTLLHPTPPHPTNPTPPHPTPPTLPHPTNPALPYPAPTYPTPLTLPYPIPPHPTPPTLPYHQGARKGVPQVLAVPGKDRSSRQRPLQLAKNSDAKKNMPISAFVNYLKLKWKSLCLILTLHFQTCSYLCRSGCCHLFNLKYKETECSRTRSNS